ncbi:MAG: sigma-70 family RNA polymerase sigma factor [Chloroflexi bacterium]|nr:MAG: sigma-70 family RNA polymerase sigma factor [Chloroflexota bacterium]TME56822.1 MAG: sigma-70 family RNA polymerase sigma factor [Chloroflexota bacterium]
MAGLGGQTLRERRSPHSKPRYTRAVAETAIRSVEPIEGLIAAAQAGDNEAFRHITEPYYRELHMHCYRMLGSFHDAEDAVQETFVRAWRGLATFQSRAQFRSWLYKIATNACLRQIERRPSRVLSRQYGPPADPTLPPSPPVSEIVRLEPYPDLLLGDQQTSSPDPETVYILRESMELAFLAAIQLLPGRQRAALLLRDVLGWRASEVANLLECSVASVNSALQRARANLAERLPPGEEDSASRVVSVAAERSLVAQYMRAWEEGDMNALAAILREDAVLTMPPASTWFQGRAAVAAFFHSLCFSQIRKRFRVLATRANGLPACAAYERDADDGPYTFNGIMVLRLEGNLVAEITGFGDPYLFRSFGLPEILDPDETP